MFSALRQNSLFYILDKKNTPSLKVAKVISISSVQYKTNLTQTVDVVVDSNGETLNFNDLPANLSIADSQRDGLVVSESKEAMLNEVESMISNSTHVLESMDYHKGVVENCTAILSSLNPQFAREQEQERKITDLEAKIVNIESGILDMKTMMSEMLSKHSAASIKQV